MSDDDFGDSYIPRALDLEVHTVPLPDAPSAQDDLRDPRSLLAMLEERSRALAYDQQTTKATLESIRSSVSRLANAGQAFAGNDSKLAGRIAAVEAQNKDLQEHVMALEKWQSEITGKAAVFASLGGFLILVLTWAMEHLRFS
jgi:septal ring factor EnvC (AmiA/AmiB activator)